MNYTKFNSRSQHTLKHGLNIIMRLQGASFFFFKKKKMIIYNGRARLVISKQTIGIRSRKCFNRVDVLLNAAWGIYI